MNGGDETSGMPFWNSLAYARLDSDAWLLVPVAPEERRKWDQKIAKIN